MVMMALAALAEGTQLERGCCWALVGQVSQCRAPLPHRPGQPLPACSLHSPWTRHPSGTVTHPPRYYLLTPDLLAQVSTLSSLPQHLRAVVLRCCGCPPPEVASCGEDVLAVAGQSVLLPTPPRVSCMPCRLFPALQVLGSSDFTIRHHPPALGKRCCDERGLLVQMGRSAGSSPVEGWALSAPGPVLVSLWQSRLPRGRVALAGQ